LVIVIIGRVAVGISVMLRMVMVGFGGGMWKGGQEGKKGGKGRMELRKVVGEVES
jgi:hypothetical protein